MGGMLKGMTGAGAVSKPSDPADAVHEGKEMPGGDRMTARVESANGSGVNLRAKRDITSARLSKIPEGAEVDVLDQQSTWCKVEYEGKTGFVKTEFLAFEEAGQEDPSQAMTDSGEKLMVLLDRSAVLKLYDACARSLGLGVG